MHSATESDVLQDIIKELEHSASISWKAALVVNDFEDRSSQDVFGNLLEEFIESLKNLERMSHDLEVTVPLNVIEKVDQGLNPDMVTKEYFQVCKKKNDEVRGRLFATKVFEDLLQARLDYWNQANPIDE